jgi:hypothetical protein
LFSASSTEVQATSAKRKSKAAPIWSGFICNTRQQESF